MTDLIAGAGAMFVATTGHHGERNQTVRTGPPGFVQVLDGHRLAWHEPAGVIGTGAVGTGPVGLLFVDLFGTGVGLHVTGAARAHGPLGRRSVEVSIVGTVLDRVGSDFLTPQFGTA